MSEKDDIKVLINGILELARGSVIMLRDLQGMLISLEAGTLPPAQHHKLKSEVQNLIAQYGEVCEALERESAPRGLTPTTFTPPDRHNESLANATVRGEILGGMEQMRQVIGRCRNGIRGAATLVGSWAQGGRVPTRSALRQAREGLEKGIGAMDALEAELSAVEQRVRWFDANRTE